MTLWPAFFRRCRRNQLSLALKVIFRRSVRMVTRVHSAMLFIMDTGFLALSVISGDTRERVLRYLLESSVTNLQDQRHRPDLSGVFLAMARSWCIAHRSRRQSFLKYVLIFAGMTFMDYNLTRVVPQHSQELMCRRYVGKPSRKGPEGIANPPS